MFQSSLENEGSRILVSEWKCAGFSSFSKDSRKFSEIEGCMSFVCLPDFEKKCSLWFSLSFFLSRIFQCLLYFPSSESRKDI